MMRNLPFLIFTLVSMVQGQEADTRVVCCPGLDPSGRNRSEELMAEGTLRGRDFAKTLLAISEQRQKKSLEVTKLFHWTMRNAESADKESNSLFAGQPQYPRVPPPPMRRIRRDPNCYDYEPARVTLQGTIIEHDGLRKWLGLRLDKPICTNEGPDEDQGLAHSNVKELHLVVFSNTHREQLKYLLGKHAEISGRLMLAITAYHMTPVLLQVDEIHNAPSVPVPPQKPKATAPTTPLPRRYFAKVTVMQSPVNRVITMAWANDPKNPFRDADNFVTYYFNGPMDILWVECRDGYRIVNIESPTGRAIFPMDGPGSKAWGLSVAPHGSSAIQITCSW
jgi:hypothetical protein